MEIAVNSTFILKGRKYVVLKEPANYDWICESCSFLEKGFCSAKDIYCAGFDRTDNVDVYFKEVER